MTFLLHFLREDDFFVDIGANIGTYTVLAGAHIGAKLIAIEPVPSTFSHLVLNISINNMGQKAMPLNIALGSKKGAIKFTSSFDTINHVAENDDKNTIEVPVETLDDILEKKKFLFC